MLVVNNLSDKMQETRLDLGAFDGRMPTNVLTDQVFPSISREPYTLRLQPYEFLWLDISP